MKNQKTIVTVLFIILSFSVFSQRPYKDLMQDNSINFYEVCVAADTYFETHDKDIKGSGWKGYQRWRYANESKYYPSGDRSNEDPYFVKKAYERFITDNPKPEEAFLFAEGWEEVGPVSIDSITGHYSPGLGRIETLFVDPADEDIMYIGSRSGGFWSTTDGGTTWNGGSTDFLFATGVNTITASPTNSDSVLINVRNSGNGTTHGIYRSVDGGDIWVETDFNPIELGKGGLGSNFKINRIMYHPVVADLIFVCASDGLYRSDDNLDTWVKVTNGSISDIEFHPTNDAIIYIYDYYYWGANKNKVLRSTDGGLTFTASADIVGNANNTSVQLDISPICEDCIYFASGNGIWKSYDSGLTFEFISDPGSGSQGFAVSDLDTTKMTYGYLDQMASDDGGYSFDQVTWWSLGSVDFDSDQYIHADMREAECINGVFYVTTDGYFAKSEDNGISWERLNNNMSIRENYTLGVSQSNHYRTIVGSQDNGTSIKHKNDWIEFWGADGMEGIIHPLNSDWMIGSNQYGGRRRTFNGGLTQGGASPPGHSSGWVAPLIYDPNNQMTVYHFGVDVHKSEDFGNTWVVIGTPSFSSTIQEAAIAENNTDIIIVSRSEHIERSIDGGVTFADIQGSLPNYGITDIAFDPKDDNTFVVTYNRYQNDGSKVYITHDMGDTWTNITANLEDMPIRGAVIDHSDNSYIYLAAEIGVYVKSMDATDWELYNDDLPNCMVYELEIVNGSNTVRAATWGRGVWEFTLKGRAPYPAIVQTWTTDQPTYTAPAEESEQYVTSLISYDYDIEEVLLKWSIDEPTFENTINMTNTVDTTWVSDSAIPNFSAGTKVYFKVMAEGEFSEITETYKFMYTVQPFEYCDSYGTMAWETSVTLVDFSDLNNPSGKPASYSSYVDLDTANVYRTMPYDLTMNMNTDGNYTIHGKAWIDWNKNGDFTDVGEEYDLGTTTDSEDGISTLSPLSIVIPADAYLGKTTMRVSAKYGSDPSSCETGFDGEVEDYSIFIKPIIDLNIEIVETEICEGDKIHFTYTGTYLDDILWTYTNGIDTYTSSEMEDSLVFESAGVYNLSLLGWEGELADGGTWASIITVHPIYNEIAELEICEGEEYIFGTQVLTESGEYTEPFTSINGCDSIVILTVEVIAVDISVTVDDYSLTANEVTATYQWLDCNAEWVEIDGATEQVFTPLENGSYAVIITNGECQDTSVCYSITELDLESFQASLITLYPNPTNGNFSIDLGKEYSKLDIEIHDATGKLIFSEKYEQVSNIAVKLILAKGIYFLTMQTTTGEIFKKEVVVH